MASGARSAEAQSGAGQSNTPSTIVFSPDRLNATSGNSGVRITFKGTLYAGNDPHGTSGGKLQPQVKDGRWKSVGGLGNASTKGSFNQSALTRLAGNGDWGRLWFKGDSAAQPCLKPRKRIVT
ncbi:hypothetical protein J5X84_27150 [Streptosporangiaceae bacterium NEAU-GS5]|nr:hypothetical protein [Streptosporangiaceae bacterium NEAU-GS5]